MLQLIGFLGCAYLAVKGFELWGQRGTSSALSTGAIVAWVAALIFALGFYEQGKEATDALNPFSSSDPTYGAGNDLMANMPLDAGQ